MMKVSNLFGSSQRHAAWATLTAFTLYFQPAMASGACKATPLDGWTAAALTWEGECKAGKANGLGVLKEYAGPNKTVSRLFFGTAESGVVRAGVIDQSDGYVAGRFNDGKLTPSDERQATIDAFKQASGAAKLVAARYRKSGNLASAKFYDGKAKQLAEQMD